MDKFYITLFIFGACTAYVNAKLNICLHLRKSVEESPEKDTELGSSNDPIFIDDFPLSFQHESLSLDGDFKNLTIWNLTDVASTLLENDQLINLTYPNILILGDYYKMKGNIGGLFDIFGEGDFRISLDDFSVSFSILSINLNVTDFCVPVSVDVDLQRSTIQFNNLMGNDTDLGDLFNKGFCSLVPEIVRGVWDEIKGGNDARIEKSINDLINKLIWRDANVRKMIDHYLKEKILAIEEFV